MDHRTLAGHHNNQSNPNSPWAAPASPTSAVSRHEPATTVQVSPTTLALASASAGPSASTAAPLTTSNVPYHGEGHQELSAAAASGSPYSPHFALLPFLIPQQSGIYQAQLLHYNKLISPTRGGGLQTQALPPVVSTSNANAHAAPRSRSSSKVSLKDNSALKGTAHGGHGSRAHQPPDKNRSAVGSRRAPQKMLSNQTLDPPPRNQPAQKSGQLAPSSSSARGQPHSNSVPSTPHQRARQFSLGSRDPSPNANHHSPRSAYSETNEAVPSLRPLSPHFVPCPYENAQAGSRRRIPYSVGNERLERLDLRTIKASLTEDEERKMATDMREIYDRLLPTTRVEEDRKKLVKKLEKIFNDEWPGHDIRAHPFGSSGNLLCSDDSDVDICITTNWNELEPVCVIASLLARRGMENVKCISGAKVPIVKIWDPELKLACDMNVNNTMALENTRLIRTYVEIDPRVRQLGMVIKYWTRRRRVNDAAFGGTLSSYTWICLIIAFLQLRDPPVLPALHQMPYKMPKPDGYFGEFADNMKKLRGFGNKNKASVAELLFQFFRFYAHEFDYRKHVLSVRHGKLLSKADKGWQLSNNNDLCVEEPFNTSRNLGNTADEYSFRGLHLELRRAFELISAAKLKEACELYEFPKEEERVWSRPPPQPRPALIRSASQTHSGRGGRGHHRGGGRHNHNYGRGTGGSNRRASSAVPAYDAHSMYMQPMMQQDLAWYQSHQFAMPYVQQDLMGYMAYQQENLRQMQMYPQSSSFLQQTQPHTLGQPQRGTNSGSTATASPSNRSRTNSFDTAPLTAPLRPDLYTLYGMNFTPAFYQTMGTPYGTYPSSPATISGSAQDFRRSLQRTSATDDSGQISTGSSLRSQSQPAARSPSANRPQAASARTSQTGTSASVFSPRNAHGVPIPSFMSDDADFDEMPKPVNGSPVSEDGGCPGVFGARSSSPPSHHQQLRWRRQRQQQQSSQPSAALVAGNIAFGDIANQSSGPNNRQQLTDQSDQASADRRQSRSPSPRGHVRAFSAGSASAALGPGPLAARPSSNNLSQPLVVNGSGLKHQAMPPAEVASRAGHGAQSTTAPSFHNPLRIQPVPHLSGYTATNPSGSSHLAMQDAPPQPLPDAPPVVANGSRPPFGLPPASDTSFRERIAMMDSYYMDTRPIAQAPIASTAHLAPAARQRAMARQPQNGVIAPLDLAVRDPRVERPADMFNLLSPVYEAHGQPPKMARTPNTAERPDATKLHQLPTKSLRTEPARLTLNVDDSAQSPADGSKSQKSYKQPPQTTSKSTGPRESGHVRGAKSDGEGSWQKAAKSKKKPGSAALQQSGHGEQPPRHEFERKGG